MLNSDEILYHSLKKAVPGPLVRLARKVIPKRRRRKNPSVTDYSSDDVSVLRCCIGYNRFGGYCIPLSSYHRPAAQKVLSGDVYEQETIDYIVNSYRGGDIIHAGTYFGDFLPALSRACVGDTKVWAFEANPENYRSTLITTFINDLRNVELTNAALGAEKRFSQMMVSDEAGTSLGGESRLVATMPEKTNAKFTLVQVVRIDDVVPSGRKIAILQLDLEGFEKSALVGAISTIKRNKPILILESVPEEKWLTQNIFGLGYKSIGNVCGNTIFRADYRAYPTAISLSPVAAG